MVCDGSHITHSPASAPGSLRQGHWAGAGHILDLRALVITDSFDEYWDHHLARQHARQYPQYTPAAA